jgi:hypothetical protein
MRPSSSGSSQRTLARSAISIVRRSTWSARNGNTCGKPPRPVRAADEHARVAAETARHAAIAAVNATAEVLQATIEQMHVVEEMRRSLRDLPDPTKHSSH